MKVKFKPEVKKMIEEGHGGWVKIILNGHTQSYDARFIETDFIKINSDPVDFNKDTWISYEIINPPYLREYFVTKGHIMPYRKEFKVILDDELFEM